MFGTPRRGASQNLLTLSTGVGGPPVVEEGARRIGMDNEFRGCRALQ